MTERGGLELGEKAKAEGEACWLRRNMREVRAFRIGRGRKGRKGAGARKKIRSLELGEREENG